MSHAGLRHVYWIGGGPCAGKSTIARRLAARYALRLYATDDVMGDHARRSTPGDSPFLREFTAMDADERWANRSPQVMLDTFHWFRGEGFGLIVEDLLRLPAGNGVIAEGFRLLPRLVAPLLARKSQAVWLLPTAEFRQAAMDGRSDGWGLPNGITDPARARRNLAERDRLFTDRLWSETRRLGLPALEVGAATTADELAGRVAAGFGL